MLMLQEMLIEYDKMVIGGKFDVWWWFTRVFLCKPSCSPAESLVHQLRWSFCLPSRNKLKDFALWMAPPVYSLSPATSSVSRALPVWSPLPLPPPPPPPQRQPFFAGAGGGGPGAPAPAAESSSQQSPRAVHSPQPVNVQPGHRDQDPKTSFFFEHREVVKGDIMSHKSFIFIYEIC